MKSQNREEIRGLEDLVDSLSEKAGQSDPITIDDLFSAAGRRSFGPLLIVPGLIVVSPLSGIPGLPSTVAVIVLLVAIQILFRQDHVWLPKWILQRKVPSSRLQRAIRFLRPMARILDKVTRERLTGLTEGVAVYPIAVLCILVAFAMPPMELLPFASSLAGAALTCLGLALIAHDGVIALIAAGFCGAGFWFVVTQILSLG